MTAPAENVLSIFKPLYVFFCLFYLPFSFLFFGSLYKSVEEVTLLNKHYQFKDFFTSCCHVLSHASFCYFWRKCSWKEKIHLFSRLIMAAMLVTKRIWGKSVLFSTILLLISESLHSLICGGHNITFWNWWVNGRFQTNSAKRHFLSLTQITYHLI